VLTRRNAIGILLGIELMLNAVNINLVAFARFRADVAGLVFTLLTISITVAEVDVGLAIVLALLRVRRALDAHRLHPLRGWRRGRRGSVGGVWPPPAPVVECCACARPARLPARPGLLAGVPRRRAGARLGPLLHLPVALRVLHARARAVALVRPDVRLLGA